MLPQQSGVAGGRGTERMTSPSPRASHRPAWREPLRVRVGAYDQRHVSSSCGQHAAVPLPEMTSFRTLPGSRVPHVRPARVGVASRHAPHLSSRVQDEVPPRAGRARPRRSSSADPAASSSVSVAANASRAAFVSLAAAASCSPSACTRASSCECSERTAARDCSMTLARVRSPSSSPRSWDSAASCAALVCERLASYAARFLESSST